MNTFSTPAVPTPRVSNSFLAELGGAIDEDFSNNRVTINKTLESSRKKVSGVHEPNLKGQSAD